MIACWTNQCHRYALSCVELEAGHCARAKNRSGSQVAMGIARTDQATAKSRVGDRCGRSPGASNRPEEDERKR